MFEHWKSMARWLNQPIWKIWVKLEIFPQVGVKIKNIWNHMHGFNKPFPKNWPWFIKLESKHTVIIWDGDNPIWNHHPDEHFTYFCSGIFLPRLSHLAPSICQLLRTSSHGFSSLLTQAFHASLTGPARLGKEFFHGSFQGGWVDVG